MQSATDVSTHAIDMSAAEHLVVNWPRDPVWSLGSGAKVQTRDACDGSAQAIDVSSVRTTFVHAKPAGARAVRHPTRDFSE